MINQYDNSWQEQAFAEDSCRFLGGYIWPPKSYYCSFCKREFRSAQALGGHMNVHRKEKARLKHESSSNIPQTEVVPHSHALNPCTSRADTGPFVSPCVRVSPSPTTEENCQEKVFVAENRDGVLDSIKKEDKKWTIVETVVSSRAGKECFTDDLSSNLIICPKPSKTSSDEEATSSKRRRLNFVAKLSTVVDRYLPQSEVFKLCCGSAEELDLELRLGDAPKVMKL